LLCEVCQRGFALRTDLDRHIKARHRVGSKLFFCLQLNCAFKTPRKDNLSKHIRKIHKLSKTPHRNEGSFSEPRDEAGFTVPSTSEDHDNKIYNSSLLLQAAERGNISLLEACMEAGIPLETKADDGSTALHCAARAGQTATVQYLLGKGAQVRVDGRTALHEAILSGITEIVRLLLFHMSKTASFFDVPNLEKCLVRCGNLDIVQLYLDRLDAESELDNAPQRLLAAASHLGDALIVAMLLQRPDVDVNKRVKGMASIHSAARIGHIEVLKLLVSYEGTDLHCTTSRGQYTALHVAAFSGMSDIVRLLLAQPSIQVNAAASGNHTPLHLAATEGHLDVVKQLIAHEAIYTCRQDWLNKTALHKAAFNGHWHIVHLLLKYSGNHLCMRDPPSQDNALVKSDVIQSLLVHEDFQDVNVSDITYPRRSLLHHASGRGDCDAIRVLLGHKDINVNLQDWYGYTSLMVAVKNNHIEAVRPLVEHNGIEINRKINVYLGSETALCYAKQRGNQEIIDLLLSHGAIDDETKPSTIVERASNASSTTMPNNAPETAPEFRTEIPQDDLMDDDMTEDWDAFLNTS
jgi:ankyrin repeat protein